MDLHYITLKRQADFLNKCLQNGTITACYTQKKNEMIIEVPESQAGSWQVQLSADSNYPFILLRDPRKRTKNSTTVLEELVGLQIKNLRMWEGERIMAWNFTNSERRLLAQLFRHQSNFFLADNSDKIIAAFKKQKKHSGTIFQLKPQHLQDPLRIDADEFIRLIRHRDNAPLDYLLRKNFLYLSGLFVKELSIRTGINLKRQSNKMSDAELRNLHHNLISLVKACGRDSPRVYLEDEVPVAFTLTKFRKYDQYESRLFDSINEALGFYIFRRQNMEQLSRKKERITNQLNKKIDQLSHIIRQLENMPEEDDRRAYYRKMGELLLAQMHQLPPGKEEIDLTDYYDPDQRSIRVRLNPELSLPENAEDYFRKAKASERRHRELRHRLRYLHKQLNELQQVQGHLQHPVNFKELNRIEKRLTTMHILQTDVEKMDTVYKPYKQYFFKEWEIWVGKNAKANDEMTFHTAHKEDVWLHAQGAAGSHVVIRKQNRKTEPPGPVLEHAARLAATNSAARHSSYVPVMVTQVKYVRKPRRSPPGIVLPERTKTLFVEPLR